MRAPTIIALEQAFQKCSDCLLHEDYVPLLRRLETCDLTAEHIAYLQEKCLSQKHIWEIRFEHLRVLLLNPEAQNYNLKEFFSARVKASRRLSMKLFYIRGLAMYATEAELEPIMDRFCTSLEKNHNYIDYNDILSVAGLPYLVDVYGYDCFCKAYQKAQEEVQRISPLLLGGFTRDSRLRQVILRSPAETIRREKEFLASLKKNP